MNAVVIAGFLAMLIFLKFPGTADATVRSARQAELSIRLDKPTGAVLCEIGGVNFKTSAPAGQASRGPVDCGRSSPEVASSLIL